MIIFFVVVVSIKRCLRLEKLRGTAKQIFTSAGDLVAKEEDVPPWGPGCSSYLPSEVSKLPTKPSGQFKQPGRRGSGQSLCMHQSHLLTE